MRKQTLSSCLKSAAHALNRIISWFKTNVNTMDTLNIIEPHSKELVFKTVKIVLAVEIHFDLLDDILLQKELIKITVNIELK